LVRFTLLQLLIPHATLLNNFRLANLTEASQIIDYISMCIIYLFFYRALKAQGYDRKDLPYYGWGQPYCAWFGLITMIFTVAAYGYTTFLPGCKFAFILSTHASLTIYQGWDVGTFFSYYTMCFACPVLYVGWKLLKRSKFVKSEEADLVCYVIPSFSTYV
jgi:amino acid transporter